MNNLLKAAVLATVLTTGVANASEFDFSYTFNTTDSLGNNNDVITGTFFATLDRTGTYFTNVSNVQAALNGVQFLNDSTSGSLDVTAWNTTTSAYDATIKPVISTNAALNNFVFGDTNAATNISGLTNYFVFTNDPSQGQNVGAYDANVSNSTGNQISVFDSPATTGAGSWTVSAVTAVPLPTTLPMLLTGLGLLAAAARRRINA
jgi:hypothetical protein